MTSTDIFYTIPGIHNTSWVLENKSLMIKIWNSYRSPITIFIELTADLGFKQVATRKEQSNMNCHVYILFNSMKTCSCSTAVIIGFQLPYT